MKTNNKSWRGYTFDELQQAIEQNKFETELDRTRIVMRLSMLKNNSIGANAQTYRRLLGALNLADYVVLGVKAFKIFAPLFKRHRKNS